MPYTYSDPASASIIFKGVWIHDAEDDLGAHHFPYGANSRETSIDPMGAGTFYAGRTAPVFDYGENESTVVGVTIDVPHGPSYRSELATLEAFARARKAVWFRDNRGRAEYGIMRGFRHADEAWGSTVSFTIERAHRVITTAVV